MRLSMLQGRRSRREESPDTRRGEGGGGERVHTRGEGRPVGLSTEVGESGRSCESFSLLL